MATMTAARARSTRRRGKTATAAGSDDGDAAVAATAATAAAPARKRARQPSSRAPAGDDEQDAETDALLAAVGQDTRKISVPRKRASGAILAEFTSLDALLSNDMEEKQRKRQREARLQRLRAEVRDGAARKRRASASNGDGEAEEEDEEEDGDGDGSAGAATADSAGATLTRLMNAMEHNIKRSMSAKSKISATPKTPPATAAGSNAVPFPTLNMQFVLAFLVLSLRTNLLRLDGYDAFSFTMFFLRMQFEHDMHPEIVQLASVCIEELLEVFPALEWRREWAPSLVLRIAGASEGLFDSAAGWLAVARRLPRTTRGTQLTTGLAIYVLQHRIDKSTTEASNSEKPLKFPIPSGLVLDIVAGIVDDLTVKYAEAKAQKRAKKQKKSAASASTEDADASNGTAAAAAAASAPTLDLLCKKVALMDLALQAFLNILTQKEMAILLKKLDELTGTHKSTMSAKWHELKTLVSLMHRKYSLENLRIGRDALPIAKAALFVDESTSG
ncbi:hypothetical protein ATCC90586_000797 [Pythium insidiosum]|nr:hypothetical protein ATCC90586_000797 [Pythium insidiosum]